MTPPYIVGAIASIKTTPATFTLMVYDPRNGQNLDVIAHPFNDGTTTQSPADGSPTLFELTGYHTLRGVYSTADGFNFDQAPQLLCCPESPRVLIQQRLLLRLLFAAAVFVGRPRPSRRRLGLLWRSVRFRRQSEPDRRCGDRRHWRNDAGSGTTTGGAWRGWRRSVQPRSQSAASPRLARASTTSGCSRLIMTWRSWTTSASARTRRSSGRERRAESTALFLGVRGRVVF